MGKFAGFNSVKLNRPLRSLFDLSHDVRLTTRMGRLTPILCEECVPSDTFHGSSEVLVRLAPLLAPIYDQIHVYVHYFFVPNRLLWDEWETFITGGRLGIGVDPAVAPVPPYYNIGQAMNAAGGNFIKSTLHDYLGGSLYVERGAPAEYEGLKCNMLPYLTYHLIWFEYYRDRNFVGDDFFEEPMPLPSGEVDGDALLEYTVLRTRSWEHDYFTSALPFTQRGEEVMLPISVEGYVPLAVNPLTPDAVSVVQGLENGLDVGWGPVEIVNDSGIIPDGEIRAHIENVSSVTSINDFRSAYSLQVWLERNAIGGSRYNESTQAHFGVKPQDSRLQRPEYIGGGRIQVQISEVLSTAWSTDAADAAVPQANMAGRGISYGNTNRFNYFCTEHGFIMGILSIMNPPSYMQGQPRMMTRESFLDYPWPTFAKLGEQPVYDYEIFTTPASLTKDTDGEYPLFGYQSRYADWKYRCSRNAGDFRDSLLHWTLTRSFSSAPVLGSVFNEVEDALQNRIFAVAGQDGFWLYVHNNLHVKRPLPYFGTPNTLGFGS